MSSAADLYEQDLLRSFGQGVEIWLADAVQDRRADRRLITSGRWGWLHGTYREHGLVYEYM